jgi:ABC-type transporter Mla MlaB component
MLRITVDEKENVVRLRLEGKLVDEWVKELDRCWIRTKSAKSNAQLIIDLSSVSFVNDEGKALLVRLVSEGAELHAHTPMMKSLIDAIFKQPHAAEKATAANTTNVK